MTDAQLSLTGLDLPVAHRTHRDRTERAVRGGTLAHAIEQGRNRLIVTAAMFALAFGAVGLRLIDATVLSRGTEPAVVRAVAEPPPAGRADIVDRNGVLLATSLATASVYADPALVIDPVEAADKLLAVLPELDRDTLLSDLRGDRRFVWIKRNLTPREHYAIFRLGIPGIAFQREERRIYPQGSLAAHVVGFTGVDNTGLAGIEKRFDQDLRGATEPLRLSLDVRLQHILRRELVASMGQFQAIGASGLIMDAHNGEVLAMVSLPDFDPHQPTGLDEETLFNRNTLGVYEMGSTFKILNTALALESGVVEMDDAFDATKPLRVGRFTISDFHGKGRWLTVPEIFMYSSNIGSVRMALDVGTEAQRAFMGSLGMLTRSPIELPEVGAPIAPSPWREINTMTIAFGHGMAVSPIQLSTAIGAMVNDGILYPPTLLKRPESGQPEGRRVISPQTSDQMRRLMRLVVGSGTATAADVPGYLVGGKTGTAEKTQGRTYNRKARLSSFVGAFPMNAPRYVVFVMLDEPKGTKETFGYATGGWVAAPAVGRIVKEIGPLLGVRPVDETAPEIRQAVDIEIHPRSSTFASY